MLIPILSSITFLITLFLGIFVYFYHRHSRVNQSFSIFTFSIAIWLFTNLMVDLSTTEAQGLFWTRLALVGPIFMPLFFLYFVTVFPREIIKIKPKTWFFLIIPALIILALTPTKIYVESFKFISPFQTTPSPGLQPVSQVEITFGPLYIFFTIYFILYMGAGLIILLRSYKKSTEKEKLKLKYLLLGLFISLFFVVATNAILPIFGEARFSGIGPSFTLVFLFFTIYAIIRRKLFDIKIVLTTLFVALIASLLILDATIFTEKFFLQILKYGVLIIFLCFGYLLIRSVLREIHYREEIKRAYEVEKKAHEKEKSLRKKAEELTKEFKRLDAAKDQFIMATQHHLRTPLTSMQGYLDLIFGGYYGKAPKKLQAVLEKFWTSTRSEIKIVNELLDISQFQLGKEVVFLQPNIQIEPLLEEIIEELKFEAESKGIYLKLEKPLERIPDIKASPEKLKVALFNIIDNGIKYTKRGGVTVKCQITNSKLQIIVEDTGMGIPKEELSTLFTKTFERGELAKKTWGPGKGIGLYLTANIIRAHRGNLWAESEGRDKGSTFYVELPIK